MLTPFTPIYTVIAIKFDIIRRLASDPKSTKIAAIVNDVDPSAESVLEESETLGAQVLTNTEGELFMTIYKNTGSDQELRSSQNGRTVLDTGTEEALYSVRLEENNWSGWTPEQVQEALHIITTNWFND